MTLFNQNQKIMKNPVTTISSIITLILGVLSALYPNIFGVEEIADLSQNANWIVAGVFGILAFILGLKAKDGKTTGTENF